MFINVDMAVADLYVDTDVTTVWLETQMRMYMWVGYRYKYEYNTDAHMDTKRNKAMI